MNVQMNYCMEGNRAMDVYIFETLWWRFFFVPDKGT
jgi:hypothetical protein